MRTNILFILILATVLQSSCKKKEPENLSTFVPKDFPQIFDDFWNKMNSNYVFWDIDTTNWDRIYQLYKPKFAELDIQNDTDVRKSLLYFQQMTENLIDNHFSIRFYHPAITNTSIFPALNRKELDKNFHNPYAYIQIDSLYLDPNFVYGESISSQYQKIQAICGTIDKKILYFSCNEFDLSEAYNSNVKNGVQNVLNLLISQIASNYSALNAIILDVRNTPGGSVSDLSFLLEKLISKPLQIGYTKYKSSTEKYSYTPWVPTVINASANSREWAKPIIILADSYTISLGETLVLAIKALPTKTYFVGETTWGATGPLASADLYNSGQFSVGTFLKVFTSSAQFKYLDNKIYENTGIKPDVAIPFNVDSLKLGIDMALNKAILLTK